MIYWHIFVIDAKLIPVYKPVHAELFNYNYLTDI